MRVDVRLEAHERIKSINARIAAAAARNEKAKQVASPAAPFTPEPIIWRNLTGKEPPNSIITRIAHDWGFTSDDLIGRSQCRDVVNARYAALRAVHEAYPKFSLPRLGRLFGGRDHTTILNAFQRMGITPPGGYTNKPWTQEEDDRLKVLWCDRVSLPAISARMRRPLSTIWRHSKRLGLPPRVQVFRPATASDAAYIRNHPNVRIKDLCRTLGLSRNTVGRIRSGQTFKGVK